MKGPIARASYHELAAMRTPKGLACRQRTELFAVSVEGTRDSDVPNSSNQHANMAAGNDTYIHADV